MVGLFCKANSSEREVVISEENALVYKGQFCLPAPGKNWQWREGGFTQKVGVTHEAFFCTDLSTDLTFIFLWSKQKQTTFNEEFMGGFVRGYSQGMEGKGWKLAEFEITPSNIPWERSYRFVAEYTSAEGSRLSHAGLVGACEDATRLYTLMYHTFEAPDWKLISDFAAGLELLSGSP